MRLFQGKQQQHAPVHLPGSRHQLYSAVGYGSTKDERPWRNPSIWAGDVIQTREGYYLMFYSSYDLLQTDGFAQSVGMAQSRDMVNWTRLPTRITPDPRYYATPTSANDITIHAWRNPCVFMYEAVPHMILTAKKKTGPIGKNGCIALLRYESRDYMDWEVLPPIVDVGCGSELETPRVMIDAAGDLYVAFNSWAKHDGAPGLRQGGGLYVINIGPDLYRPAAKAPELLMPESEGLDDCSVTDDLGGEIVATGITTPMSAVGRDFSAY